MAEGEATETRAKSRRYTRSEALARARALTGENRHVVAGAIVTDPDKRESWTEGQLKKLVKDFVDRVPPEHQPEPEQKEEAA